MAQGTYTVSTQPVQSRTYPNKHGGNLVVWRLGLQDAESAAPDRLFELHKKEGNEPRLGDVLDVERSQEGEFNGEPFVRLFLAKPQGVGSSSAGGSSQGSNDPSRFDRKPEHPRNEARIIHTSALSAAPGYINQMLAMGWLAAPKDEDAYWALVAQVAGRLRKSYQGALGAAESPQQTLPPQEVPADTAGLTNGGAAAKATDDVPFRRLPVPDREVRRRDLFVSDERSST